MIKEYFECPYIVSKFEMHNEIKDALLNSINTNDYSSVSSGNYGTKIYRSDWYLERDERYQTGSYQAVLKDPLMKHMKNVFTELGFERFRINNMWFQQYNYNSEHSWHVHNWCNWSSVYYLQLPKNAPGTEMMWPKTKEMFTPAVEEGDILTFPSFLFHRAPLVTEDIIKTIIAFDSDSLTVD